MIYLVKGDGHDSVRGVKGFLDAVAVVNVYIDVDDALMIFQEFEYGDDDVVDVAEAGRLRLFGVMQAAGPVDGDVRLLLVEFHSPGHGSARRDLAEFVETVEHRTVLAHVEPLELRRD